MGDGWLEGQELRRSQYRSPRRAPLRGVIELHTAEGVMDTVGPDTGAEAVARFIVARADPGSYHDICDSDSHVQLVDYDDEAYHDGTGMNPSTTSVSWACRTVDWAQMSATRRRAFLDTGARRAAAQARHQHARTGKVVRPVRLTKAQVLAGQTGFLYHGDSDSDRRSDPGTQPADPFPWDEFIELYRIHAAGLLGGTPPQEDLMVTDDDAAKIRTIVREEVQAQGMATAAAVVELLTLGPLGRWARQGLAYARSHARQGTGTKVREAIAAEAGRVDAAELAKARTEIKG